MYPLKFNRWDFLINSYLKTLSWFPSICLLLVDTPSHVSSRRGYLLISICFQGLFTFIIDVPSVLSCVGSPYIWRLFPRTPHQCSTMSWIILVSVRRLLFLASTEFFSLSYPGTLHTPDPCFRFIMGDLFKGLRYMVALLRDIVVCKNPPIEICGYLTSQVFCLMLIPSTPCRSLAFDLTDWNIENHCSVWWTWDPLLEYSYKLVAYWSPWILPNYCEGPYSTLYLSWPALYGSSTQGYCSV